MDTETHALAIDSRVRILYLTQTESSEKRPPMPPNPFPKPCKVTTITFEANFDGPSINPGDTFSDNIAGTGLTALADALENLYRKIVGSRKYRFPGKRIRNPCAGGKRCSKFKTCRVSFLEILSATGGVAVFRLVDLTSIGGGKHIALILVPKDPAAGMKVKMRVTCACR
jgi:hypothetical protein